MDYSTINLIPAKVCGSPKHIWLELEDTTRLQIPLRQQERLFDYLHCNIEFGINPEFIELGESKEELNVCLGKLTSIEDNMVQFTIADHPVVARIKDPDITRMSMGQVLKVNFDTFFGHVFDPETQVNLTI